MNRRWPWLLAMLIVTAMTLTVNADMPPIPWVRLEPDRTVQATADFQDSGVPFAFAITTDMRYFSGPGVYDTSDYFRGAVEALDGIGAGAFMISPGDIDPPDGVLWTITTTLGAAYTWYPVVGNHELPGQGQEALPGANMDWLRSYDYGPVNAGPTGCPTTTYSFDHGDAHLVVLNVYCDVSGDTATGGDIPDHLYDWLVADLSSTDKPFVFVFGHEPAFPQADVDTGRERHKGNSLDQYPSRRDHFWSLLQAEGVVAYICGHTHNYSAVNIDGVWQVDAGHARGAGDTGAPSTFVMVRVNGGHVTLEAHRDYAGDGAYPLAYTETLVEEAIVGLSVGNDSPTAFSQATTLTATVAAGSNTTFTWDFGDGYAGSGPAVQHTYLTVGRFTAVADVSNSVSHITGTTVVTIEGYTVYFPLVGQGP